MELRTYHSRRWLAAWLQAAVVLGLPFIRIGGESALRFDVPSLKLYFFGSVVWISEAYFFLLVFLLFFVGVMLFTVLYGRVWCGWMCPQTVLTSFSRLIEKVSRLFSGNGTQKFIVRQAALFLLSALVAASLIWYFVSPYDMAGDIAAGSLGPWTTGSWIFFTALFYLNFAFVRQRFCTTVCPYARLQSAFFDHKTLTIAFDTRKSEECHGCEACVRDCPSGIDIRKGLQVECINCAECIDACTRQTARVNRKPLIGYFRGDPGAAASGKSRPRVIGLAAASAFIAALLVYQVHVRMPVDFLVLRDNNQPHHQITAKGAMLNVYNLVIENRSLSTATYHLSVSGIKDAELVLAQNPLVVPANSSVALRVYVLANRKNVVYRITQLEFILENTLSKEIRIMQQAPFVTPDRSAKGVEI